MDFNFDNFWKTSIIKWESGGKFHKISSDPGGATKWGVADHADGTVDGLIDLDRDGKGDVKVCDLTEDQAKEVYKHFYLNTIRFNNLPSGIDIFLADTAVNIGTKRASKFLQYAVGAKQDGVIGPKTMNAVEVYLTAKGGYFNQQREILRCLASKRMAHYQMVTGYRFKKYDPDTALMFSQGWANRTFDVYDLASDLLIPF